MKQFYLIVFALFSGLISASAQKATALQFVTINEAGQETGVVADGAVIQVSTVTDNGLDPFISTGLGVKNTSGADVRAQIEYVVERIDNGSVTCCFATCAYYKSAGRYFSPLLSKRGNVVNLPNVKSGAVRDLASEWTFADDGQCRITFTVKVGTKNTQVTDSEGEVYDVVDGPSVTVNFVKGDATGIHAVSSKSAVKTSFYDLTGRPSAHPVKGVYIRKQVLSDGTTRVRKVVLK